LLDAVEEVCSVGLGGVSALDREPGLGATICGTKGAAPEAHRVFRVRLRRDPGRFLSIDGNVRPVRVDGDRARGADQGHAHRSAPGMASATDASGGDGRRDAALQLQAHQPEVFGVVRGVLGEEVVAGDGVYGAGHAT